MKVFVFSLLLVFVLRTAQAMQTKEASASTAYGNSFQVISNSPLLNEYMGSSIQLSDGRVCFFLESIPDFNELEAFTYRTCQDTNGKFQPATLVFPIESARLDYIQNPRVVSFNGKSFVYFNAWDKTLNLGFWGRAEVQNENIGKIEWLTAPVSLQGQFRPWIYPYPLNSGELLLTFELRSFTASLSEVRFSVSSDGQTFRQSQIYQDGAQMTRFAEFADGTWAFVYQVGRSSNMMDYIRLSKDKGQTLLPAIPVSSLSNVHDPIFLERKDGRLDVYYIVWLGSGFSLHRRKVFSDGTLGKEERLTDNSDNVQKPNAFRLKNGKILVSFGVVTSDSSQVIHTDLMGMTLDSDAP